MRIPPVPPFTIPKPPKLPSWGPPARADSFGEEAPSPSSFADAVIRAAMHVAERAYAQMLAAPAPAVAAQTTYLNEI